MAEPASEPGALPWASGQPLDQGARRSPAAGCLGDRPWPTSVGVGQRWRCWFLRQLRRPASVSVGAVLGTDVICEQAPVIGLGGRWISMNSTPEELAGHRAVLHELAKYAEGSGRVFDSAASYGGGGSEEYAGRWADAGRSNSIVRQGQPCSVADRSPITSRSSRSPVCHAKGRYRLLRHRPSVRSSLSRPEWNSAGYSPRKFGLLNVSMTGIGMHVWSPYVPPLTPGW